MTHYLIELAIYVIIAYVLGCIIGWLLRNIFGGNAAEVATAGTAAATAAAPAMTAATAAAAGTLTKPAGIAAARGGKADELQRISGIGPKNESILNNLGFYHFDQMAAWTKEEVAWVDDHLRFGGRVEREEWVRQASLLAQGKEDEFAKEFGTGGMKGADGQTHSGSHTKK